MAEVEVVVSRPIRRYPVADRPTAGVTRAGIRSPRKQIRQVTTAKMRLVAAQVGRFGSLIPSTADFDRLLPASSVIYRFPNCQKAPFRPRNCRKSGEYRRNRERRPHLRQLGTQNSLTMKNEDSERKANCLKCLPGRSTKMDVQIAFAATSSRAIANSGTA